MRRQRKQDFYVNYAANDHYVSASMQDERTPSHDRRLRAAGAGRDRRRRAGRAPADWRAAPRGLPRRVPESAGFRHCRHAVERRADREGEADADDPARDHVLRARHRVRERRQPDADPPGAARAGDGDSRVARRARSAAPPSAAGREPRALDTRRCARARACRRRPQPADQVHQPVHEPHGRDRARRLGPRLHAGGLDRHGARLCLGAAIRLPERSGARDGKRRGTGHRRHRPAPRAARAGRQPARGVLHVAHCRRDCSRAR